MKNVDLIENKEIREQMVGRVDVLDKVKELFLIPELEVMTVKQVAEYFEVDIDVIKRCYQRNTSEINSDGTVVTKANKLMEHLVPLEKKQGSVVFQFDENTTLEIPYRGIRCFSKRAVLRIAMLLRDSIIAQEVRTQLLNTFEHSTVEQRTEDINEETKLMIEIGRASMSGDMKKINVAYANAFAFKNRHIAKLEEENKELEYDNQTLAGEILSWTDRASLNKAVRIIASNRCVNFGTVWNELYNELYYKHNISLRARGNAPYINHIRENEWSLVNQSICAICEENGLSLSKIAKKAKIS